VTADEQKTAVLTAIRILALGQVSEENWPGLARFASCSDEWSTAVGTSRVAAVAYLALARYVTATFPEGGIA
jgi:hypothetical protein